MVTTSVLENEFLGMLNPMKLLLASYSTRSNSITLATAFFVHDAQLFLVEVVVKILVMRLVGAYVLAVTFLESLKIIWTVFLLCLCSAYGTASVKRI